MLPISTITAMNRACTPTETQNDWPKWESFSPRSKWSSPRPAPWTRGGFCSGADADGAVDGVAMEGVELIFSIDELSRKVQKRYLDWNYRSMRRGFTATRPLQSSTPRLCAWSQWQQLNERHPRERRR